MAKRLRGWQLEMHSGRASKRSLEKPSLEKDSLEKESRTVASALANKLLTLWAQGTLSAVLIRDLADLAIQDGAEGADLIAIAKAGSWGSHPGNTHRQIMNKFCADIHIPDPHHGEVACINPKTSKNTLEKAAMFLPHLAFARLGEYLPEFFIPCSTLEKVTWKSFGEVLKGQAMKSNTITQ